MSLRLPLMRAFRPEDESALYEICLRTGASGEDASALYADPRLLGSVYVGPYLRFAPDLALVAEDANGVAGYVLGAPDTRAFEEACETDWWPPLRRRYPRTAFPPDDPDARLVENIHAPPRTGEVVIETYPAHLHIDLLPRLQGRGYGRRLVAALFDRLTGIGVGGVHLGVALANQRAIGFYQRVGFAELSRSSGALIMGRRLG